MLRVWNTPESRPTRDIDLLGYLDGEVATLETAVRDVCDATVEDDGLRFDMDTIHSERSKEDAYYEGVRIKLAGYLERSQIRSSSISPLVRSCTRAPTSASTLRFWNSQHPTCGPIHARPSWRRSSRRWSSSARLTKKRQGTFLDMSKKEREDMIFAFGILGDTDPISVSFDGAEPIVEPSCDGQADAAVRIAEFLGALADKISTACAPDLSSILAEFGALTAAGLRQAACASGVLADGDPGRPCPPLICDVVDASWLGKPAEVRADLVSCQDEPAARPCYSFAQDEEICSAKGAPRRQGDPTIPSASLTRLARC